MKILIAGYGYVGKAQELVFQNYHNIHIYDPALGYTECLDNPDAVIVCVSTPPRKDGSCEMTNVFEVIEASPDVPILIKSTISVEGWEMLADTFPNKQICFSPEFLRAAHWKEDARAKHIYLGGNCTNFWSDLFLQVLDKPTISVEQPADLVAAKALRNSFLALKVSFFNQVFDYCEAYKLDTDAVIKTIIEDQRIGSSHSTITSERGFGGHCLPKDVSAIIRSAQRNNTRLTLLEEANNYNHSIRKGKDQT
jgi:UDPglucose 6-dehydrogenase